MSHKPGLSSDQGQPRVYRVVSPHAQPRLLPCGYSRPLFVQLLLALPSLSQLNYVPFVFPLLNLSWLE